MSAPPPKADGAAMPKREMAALRQIRESAEVLWREGKAEESFDLFLAALEAVLIQNRDLELLVAKLRRERSRPRSERLDPGQLALLLEAFADQGAPEVEVDPEAEAREDAALDNEIKEAEKAKGKGKGKTGKRRTRGAGWKTRGIERQVHRIEVPPEERVCGRCGDEKKCLGVDITRRLELQPARFLEHEHHREKWACGRCKEGVTTAPGPEQVLERSAADASLLAHVVVSKYVDHTPLHRLHRIYARSGVEIPVSTLADWTAGVGTLVDPLVGALSRRVLDAYIVRTDASGLRVLDPQRAEHIQCGTMWALVGDDRDVLFRYTPTGEGETGPWEFLAGRTGYIQADAASVFDRLFNGQAASAIELGCWSHGRRRLVALADMDCRVAYPLKLIARLYRIEHLADAREVTPEGRVALRQERSQPIVEKLQRWFLATHQTEPPSTDLAKAATYPLNHWKALTRFLEDGRVSLDNNICEQQFRDLALGRKNYLFAGSHDAARRAASLYSLTRTCIQYKIPPLPYLTDILGKLARGWPADKLEALLPHRWQPPANGP